MSRRTTSTRVAFAAIILLALTQLPAPRHAAVLGHQRFVAAGATIVINEVDSDQASTDTMEFVELYDGGAGNTALDGHVVVFFNGGAVNDASYAAFDLDGHSTNAQGYFTLGNSAVPGVDLVFSNGLLQNGPDAVALFLASATDFPNATPITTTNIQDAIAYSNTATIDSGLLVLLNAGQPQVNENGAGTGTTVSMQRVPNGLGGQRNTDFFQLHAPTPDGPNFGPTSVTVSLSGRVTNFLGLGIPGAQLTIEGNGLSSPRLAKSSSFGYYMFEGLSMGTYMITVASKRYTFAEPSRMVTLNENVADLNFVAEPEQ